MTIKAQNGHPVVWDALFMVRIETSWYSEQRAELAGKTCGTALRLQRCCFALDYVGVISGKATGSE